ncbi:HEAT repeat domain-containing protein [Chamaesiphon sp. VAR_48_metabat_403]|uniref:HEAT repeat domain-containing protein n=1 Tax=Chamaesiphon sp. VAR_48_metabat_403 TaxID=2964700 RepID=UPI00286D7F20|nr:HEAT repeat domain-containing protein [Chamaesiphon sp. VAR_48_metabat_403]
MVSKLIELLPILLVSTTIIIEPIGVMRSDAIVQSQPSPTAEIDASIEQLKAGDEAALTRQIDNSIEQLKTARSVSQLRLNQYILTKIGTKTIPKLILLLQDKEAATRSSATTVLANIGAATIPDLMPLLADRDKNVRSSAVSALGKMGTSAKSTIPNLIPLLNDEDLEVRSIVVTTLKQLGYKP